MVCTSLSLVFLSAGSDIFDGPIDLETGYYLYLNKKSNGELSCKISIPIQTSVTRRVIKVAFTYLRHIINQQYASS